MQDVDALVRCAATADVLRTGLHVQVSRVRRNQASACCYTAFGTQRSKVESLRALHQYTNVQRRSALHAAPATLVARPAPVESLHSSITADGSWCTSGGISLRPLTLRCVCNSACDDRVAARVCMPMQSKTRGNHRSVSASGCTMRCDGRSSSSRAAGSMERLLRAVYPNRSLASSDAAKLGGSQAALHRPSAPSSECCRTNRGQTRPRSTTAAPPQAGGLPASLARPHCGI